MMKLESKEWVATVLARSYGKAVSQMSKEHLDAYGDVLSPWSTEEASAGLVQWLKGPRSRWCPTAAELRDAIREAPKGRRKDRKTMDRPAVTPEALAWNALFVRLLGVMNRSARCRYLVAMECLIHEKALGASGRYAVEAVAAAANELKYDESRILEAVRRAEALCDRLTDHGEIMIPELKTILDGNTKASRKNERPRGQESVP